MSSGDQNLQASIEHVRICRTCFALYETEHPSGKPLLCRCKTDDDTYRSGSDFNEHVHLCECCRTEVVASGDGRVVFFCRDCRIRAEAVNERAGTTIVPIERNSAQEPEEHVRL